MRTISILFEFIWLSLVGLGALWFHTNVELNIISAAIGMYIGYVFAWRKWGG